MCVWNDILFLRFRLWRKSLEMIVLGLSGLSLCILKSPMSSILFLMVLMLFSKIDTISLQNCNTLVFGIWYTTKSDTISDPTLSEGDHIPWFPRLNLNLNFIILNIALLEFVGYQQHFTIIVDNYAVYLKLLKTKILFFKGKLGKIITSWTSGNYD